MTLWADMTRQQQMVAWHEIELRISDIVHDLGKDITAELTERYGIPFMVKISIEYEPLGEAKERMFT